MSKVMFSFPDQLVARMKAAIPNRERSKIIALLLEKEINKREQALFMCAKTFESHQGLKEEALERDKIFSQDGLEDV